MRGKKTIWTFSESTSDAGRDYHGKKAIEKVYMQKRAVLIKSVVNV
jgi:hypothetical protein